METEEQDIVHIRSTRRARRLLRVISGLTGQPMQSEAERIFEQELKQIEGRNDEKQTRTGNT